MKGLVKVTTVEGKEFKVWSDFIERATFAEDENGAVEKISSGYLKKDLTIRKAIQSAYGLESFKKGAA